MVLIKYSPISCRSMALDGVPKRAYNQIVHGVFKISDKDFASIAGTSVRTLARLKPDQLLPFQTAEVIISLMRAHQKATEIFGSEEKSVEWLKSPNAVLGGISPVQALNSRFGAEEVMDILGRIEYGVYS